MKRKYENYLKNTEWFKRKKEKIEMKWKKEIIEMKRKKEIIEMKRKKKD